MQVRFFGGCRICFGNITVFGHLVKDNALAVFRRFQTAERGIVIRAVRQSCNQCCLRQCQIFCIFSEINARCRLDTVATLSEINLVHIQFKNLLFRILALYFQGQYHFENLTFQCLFLIQKRIPCQLLGDGTASLARRISAYDIAERRTENPSRIHTVMFIKTHIFGSDKRILQIHRHLVNRNGDTVFLGMHRRNQTSFRIINAGRCIRCNIGRNIGQSAAYRNKESCRCSRHRYKNDDKEKKNHFFPRR